MRVNLDWIAEVTAAKTGSTPQERHWFGMVFVWFFFNFGFVHLFLTVFTWIGQVNVSFGPSQSGISGYIWLVIGCLALALFFAAPRRSSRLGP